MPHPFQVKDSPFLLAENVRCGRATSMRSLSVMCNSKGDCHMQVAGYAGLLLATPTVLYEIVAYVVPGLTKSEKDLLAPIVFGSSILFYIGCERPFQVQSRQGCMQG